MMMVELWEQICAQSNISAVITIFRCDPVRESKTYGNEDSIPLYRENLKPCNRSAAIYLKTSH